MPDTAGIEIRLTTVDDPFGVALSTRQKKEILQTNPGLTFTTYTDIPVFILLLRDAEAIACGGLRPISGEATSLAEIKGIYVVPEARGQAKGVSDFLMTQLELHALKQGWTTLRLQTGSTMPSANKLYERHGYRLIPNYGEYVGADHTISFEKVLEREVLDKT